MLFGSYKTETHKYVVFFGIKFKFLRKKAKSRFRRIKKTVCGSQGDKILKLLDTSSQRVERLLWLAEQPQQTLTQLCEMTKLQALPQIDRYVEENRAEHLKSIWGLNSTSRGTRVIVNVNAHPEHIYDMHLSLASLLNQSEKPDLLILWLPLELFPGGKAELPDKVIALEKRGLEVRTCKNSGYHTNLIPALQQFPGEILVTAVDYFFYSQSWLSKLLLAHRLYPNALVVHEAWTIITKDKKVLPVHQWKGRAVALTASKRLFPLAESGMLCSTEILNVEKLLPYASDALQKEEGNARIWQHCLNEGVRIVSCKTESDEVSYINTPRDYEPKGKVIRTIDYYRASILTEFPGLVAPVANEREICHHAKNLYLAKHYASPQHGKIKVAFVLWEPAFWKAEALFTAMEKHPRFTPAFWIQDMPGISDIGVRQQKKDSAIQYAEMHNHEYYDCETLRELRSQFSPDYVFAVQPYSSCIPFAISELYAELPCILPYAYCTLGGPDVYNGYKIQDFYRYYVESESVRAAAASFMKNGGRCLKVSGLPLAEHMIAPMSKQAWPDSARTKKKLIWAPHWTIENQGTTIKVSCFCDIADGMLSLAKKYKDKVHIAFKPHPRLVRALYESRQWGKSRANAYYQAWRDGENTQLEEGEYTALFQQSDAMLHDSSSFIKEYLLVDKPCLYLQRKNAMADFNESTYDALKCYQKGFSLADVESFIQQIINGEDSMRMQRKGYIDSYLIQSGISPVENIIKDMLNPS